MSSLNVLVKRLEHLDKQVLVAAYLLSFHRAKLLTKRNNLTKSQSQS
jgi:predicted Ser/Thr protein kinase